MKLNYILIGGFLIVALLVGVVGFVAYNSVTNLDEVREFHELMSVPALITLEKISTNFEMMVDPNWIGGFNQAEEKKKYETAEVNVNMLINEYDDLTFVESRDGGYVAWEEMRNMMQNFVSQMRTTIEEFDEIAQELFILYDTNAPEDEIEKKFSELHHKEVIFKEILEKDKKMESAGLERENKKIADEKKRVLKVILITSTIVILLSVILGWFISRSISKPLSEFSGAVDEVSKGNFNVDIPKDVGKVDEIKTLADSLDRVMITMKLAVDETEGKKPKKKGKSKAELEKLGEEISKNVKKK